MDDPGKQPLSDAQIASLLLCTDNPADVLAACLSHDYDADILCELHEYSSKSHVHVRIPAYLQDRAQSIADRVISLSWHDEDALEDEADTVYFFDVCWIGLDGFAQARRWATPDQEE